MPNVRVSVKQRPPTRSVASKSISLRPAAAMRRAAAMPAAPAPTMTTSMPLEAGSASAGCAATATDDARNERRLNEIMTFRMLFQRPAVRRPVPQSADRVDQPIIHRPPPSVARSGKERAADGSSARPGTICSLGAEMPARPCARSGISSPSHGGGPICAVNQA